MAIVHCEGCVATEDGVTIGCDDLGEGMRNSMGISPALFPSLSTGIFEQHAVGWCVGVILFGKQNITMELSPCPSIQVFLSPQVEGANLPFQSSLRPRGSESFQFD